MKTLDMQMLNANTQMLIDDGKPEAGPAPNLVGTYRRRSDFYIVSFGHPWYHRATGINVVKDGHVTTKSVTALSAKRIEELKLKGELTFESMSGTIVLKIGK